MYKYKGVYCVGKHLIDLFFPFISTVNSCDPSPCVNNATCVSSDNSTNFICQCPTGWTGEFCGLGKLV